MIGIIAPPNKPCKPLNNVIDRKLSEIAHPKLENIKPDKLIRKKILVDKSLISHPLKGIIMTSAIRDAENTYETDPQHMQISSRNLPNMVGGSRRRRRRRQQNGGTIQELLAPLALLGVLFGLSGKNKTTKTRRSRGSLKKKLSRRRRR